MALSSDAFAIGRVAFEHHKTALGIGEASPRISWSFEGQPPDIQNWTQSSYTLEISRSGLSEPEVFVVDSSESSLVPWPADPLGSGESAQVRVQSSGGNGGEDAETPWSDIYQVEVGILDEEAWEGAVFVAAEEEKYYQDTTRQPILFRKSFESPAGVASARLYITARGLFTAELNGKAVGDEVLAPGWQSYHHRLQYSTFDVTDLINDGVNVIGVQVGEGWYAGRLGFGGGNRDGWGDRLELLALLVITGEDGERHLVRSDGSWESGYGAIQASEIYDGEVYDFREAQPGWSGPEFTAPEGAEWNPVMETDSSLGVLTAPDGPPIRRTETVQLKEVLTTPSGKTVLDFGQNFAGWLRLQVEGPEGTNITLVHVEVLEDEEIATEPLRTAKQTDSIILSGNGVETWEPSFTFHGFRYVQVDGWPDEAKLNSESVTGIVINSDMREVGSFESSSDLLNRLHLNVKWSMRSNFVSIPTDCPQRDERLGWTGDAHSFASTANFLYDTAGFWKAWIKDVCSEQVNGVPPAVVPAPPDMLEGFLTPAAIWSDAIVAIPWDIWTSTGDPELLQAQYKCAKDWVENGINRTEEGGLWNRNAFQYGDWLDPAAPPDDPGDATTAKAYVADAYLVHVTKLLSQMATVLKLDDEAAHYSDWATDLTTAFQEAWIGEDGTTANETQTGLVLPLHFSLFSDQEHADAAAGRLQTLVEDNDFKIGTGFAGTHLIGHTLSEFDMSDTFYEMLFQTESPSWLYQVEMGGTTTWERWDSMLPDGSLNSGEMTSFNHYSHGSVASWIHGKIGGLEPLEPGWKRFKVEVIPGGPLEWADTTYYSPYGKVSTSWRTEGGSFFLEVEAPPNTEAEVILPGGDSEVVGSGKYEFKSAL